MRDLKKVGLKVFSKNNLKNLIFVFSIKTFFNTTLVVLFLLTMYSFSSYNSIENTPLYPISVAKSLNDLPLKQILVLLCIFAFLSFIPLNLGTYMWLSQLKKDDKASILTIFYYYKNSKLFIKSIFFKLALTLKSLFNFIICFVPTVGTFIFCCVNLTSFPDDFQFLIRILILISGFMIFISSYFFFKLQISQPLAKFLFVQNYSKNIFSTIKSADFLMHQNSKGFKKFQRSLLKYLPLCLLIIPVPFVFAYIRVRFFGFAKEIIYKQNQGIVAIPLTEKVIDINL